MLRFNIKINVFVFCDNRSKSVPVRYLRIKQINQPINELFDELIILLYYNWWHTYYNRRIEYPPFGFSPTN